MRSFVRLTLAGALLAGIGLLAPAFAAQPAGDGDRPYWRTNLFKRVVTDQKFLVTRWWPQELKDPLFASSLVAGIALAAQSGGQGGGGWDRRWEGTISDSSRPAVKNVSRGFTKLGNGATVAALLGITYLSSRRAHNDRLAEASSLATESLLNAGIWIEVLKGATARVRPTATGAGSFFQYGSGDNSSFPSGHAMGAFSVASVFAETYRDKRWVPWLSYGVASLISASRLTLGRHFPGDVVVGAVLGTSIGRGVVGRSREEEPSPRRMKGSIVPVVGPDGSGVGLGWAYSWK